MSWISYSRLWEIAFSKNHLSHISDPICCFKTLSFPYQEIGSISPPFEIVGDSVTAMASTMLPLRVHILGTQLPYCREAQAT